MAASINVCISTRVPAKLKTLDFDCDEDTPEEDMLFGAGKVEDFDREQMLDFYACVECGRCTDVCPASGTGKMLSPMDIMIKLRDHFTVKDVAVTGIFSWVAEMVIV